MTRDIRWLDRFIGDDYGTTASPDETDELDDATSASGENDGDESDDDKSQGDANDNDDASESNSIDDDNDSNANASEASDNDGNNNDDQNDADRDTPNQEQEDDMVGNPKLQRELQRLNTWYNPTVNELGDVAFVGGTDETYDNPEDFYEAWDHQDPNERAKWREGIRKEIKDMQNKKVWIITKIADIPSNRRLIGCRWVNKRKRNLVYRARLVALGYSQVPGVDYTDNYSPVIQDLTFRLLCVLIITFDWVAEIVDIETAFLYGDLEETIFMKVPQGYEIVTDDKSIDRSIHCMKLVKTIYGLVQAARQFYRKLSAVLTEKLKMKKCLSDQCLFGRRTSKGRVLIAVYIDDTLCIGDEEAVKELKVDISKYFATKEEGILTEYVGCEITRVGKTKLFMSQQVLIRKIERTFKEIITKLPIYNSPAGGGFKVERCTDDNLKISAEKQKLYRSGVGMLMFLVKYSRPDLANSVRELSKANDGATEKHYRGLLRTVKYVIDTRNKALKYENTHVLNTVWKLKAYCDSDFAGDQESRRSVSGYCVYIFDCLIAWKSKSQKHVTLSSTEAEYVAVSEVCTELMFIRSILMFRGIRIKLPIIVHCDNVGAIFLSYNAKVSQRTKHIDTKYRYVGEWVEEEVVKVIFVRSENNIADILTKNTPQEIFNRHTGKYLDELPE